MKQQKVIEQLEKFRRVDKYETFHKIYPPVRHAGDDHKDVVSDILDHCAAQLIALLEQPKKPTKTALKKAIADAMDAIAHAPVSTDIKEFGYELAWYLSEKAGLNMKLMSENKVWGYWKIEGSHVKTVMPKLPRTRKKKQP